MISFFDDLFVASRPRLYKIIQLLKERQLSGKVSFTCSCRTNLVDEELASILSDMGVVSVGIGLESGNDDVLMYLKGESISVEHNRKAINTLVNPVTLENSETVDTPEDTEIPE